MYLLHRIVLIIALVFSANISSAQVKLPSWIFEKQGEGRYVGVSDPGKDAEEAFNQALLRAWALSQMDAQMEVKSGSLVDGCKMESMSKISFSSLHNTTLYVGQEYVSKYGEHFVEFFTSAKSSRSGKVYRFDQGEGGIILTQDVLADERGSSMTVKETIYHPLYGNDLYDEVTISSSKEGSALKYAAPAKQRSTKSLASEVLADDPMTMLILASESLDEGYWCAFISSLILGAQNFSESYITEMSSSGNNDSLIMKTSTECAMRISMYEALIIDNKLSVRYRAQIAK